MNSYFKFLFISIVLILSTQTTRAQDTDKSITITVSGSGKTQDAAKQSALRSAIEQSFGAFISSKTEILNDQLVTDQITSVANGNIQSFLILNESQLPDGSWAVTLKVIVSISKLISFVESKGVAIEIKGSLFALNVKQELLNEEAESTAIFQMISLIHQYLEKSFDYTIQSSSPKSINNSGNKFEIPIVVTAITNKNIDFCENYLTQTLRALSLSEIEIKNYKKLNKEVYPIKYKTEQFYLRRKSSKHDLFAMFNNSRFITYYMSLYFLESAGVELTNGFKDDGNPYAGAVAWNDKGYPYTIQKESYNIRPLISFLGNRFWDNKDNSVDNILTKLIFPKSDIPIGNVSINLNVNIKQIEQMTDIKVKPILKGLIEINHGGMVIYEKNGHGLVVALSDFEDDGDAIETCQDLKLNGYSDWRLPTEEEFNEIKKKISSKFGFKYTSYSIFVDKFYKKSNHFRPVRSF